MIQCDMEGKIILQINVFAFIVENKKKISILIIVYSIFVFFLHSFHRDHKLQSIRRTNVEEDNTHSGEFFFSICQQIFDQKREREK